MPTETVTSKSERTHNSPASQADASALMIFSCTGQLVFRNRDAQILHRQFEPYTTKAGGTSLIPEEVHAVVREVISQLIHCEHPKDCETIQVERLCFTGDQRLLLRGVCIPDAPVVSNGHILIVMEKLNKKSTCPDVNIQQQYHLTDREQMVIIYLMLGFTNKEIANRLNLSEYTVKEHLKRIMLKTTTNTRTGLLARMIFPTPNQY